MSWKRGNDDGNETDEENFDEDMLLGEDYGDTYLEDDGEEHASLLDEEEEQAMYDNTQFHSSQQVAIEEQAEGAEADDALLNDETGQEGLDEELLEGEADMHDELLEGEAGMQDQLLEDTENMQGELIEEVDESGEVSAPSSTLDTQVNDDEYQEFTETVSETEKQTTVPKIPAAYTGSVQKSSTYQPQHSTQGRHNRMPTPSHRFNRPNNPRMMDFQAHPRHMRAQIRPQFPPMQRFQRPQLRSPAMLGSGPNRPMGPGRPVGSVPLFPRAPQFHTRGQQLEMNQLYQGQSLMNMITPRPMSAPIQNVSTRPRHSAPQQLRPLVEYSPADNLSRVFSNTFEFSGRPVPRQRVGNVPSRSPLLLANRPTGSIAQKKHLPRTPFSATQIQQRNISPRNQSKLNTNDHIRMREQHNNFQLNKTGHSSQSEEANEERGTLEDSALHIEYNHGLSGNNNSNNDNRKRRSMNNDEAPVKKALLPDPDSEYEQRLAIQVAEREHIQKEKAKRRLEKAKSSGLYQANSDSQPQVATAFVKPLPVNQQSAIQEDDDQVNLKRGTWGQNRRHSDECRPQIRRPTSQSQLVNRQHSQNQAYISAHGEQLSDADYDSAEFEKQSWGSASDGDQGYTQQNLPSSVRSQSSQPNRQAMNVRSMRNNHRGRTRSAGQTPISRTGRYLSNRGGPISSIQIEQSFQQHNETGIPPVGHQPLLETGNYSVNQGSCVDTRMQMQPPLQHSQGYAHQQQQTYPFTQSSQPIMQRNDNLMSQGGQHAMQGGQQMQQTVSRIQQGAPLMQQGGPQMQQTQHNAPQIHRNEQHLPQMQPGAHQMHQNVEQHGQFVQHDRQNMTQGAPHMQQGSNVNQNQLAMHSAAPQHSSFNFQPNVKQMPQRMSTVEVNISTMQPGYSQPQTMQNTQNVQDRSFVPQQQQQLQKVVTQFRNPVQAQPLPSRRAQQRRTSQSAPTRMHPLDMLSRDAELGTFRDNSVSEQNYRQMEDGDGYDYEPSNNQFPMEPEFTRPVKPHINPRLLKKVSPSSGGDWRASGRDAMLGKSSLSERFKKNNTEYRLKVRRVVNPSTKQITQSFEDQSVDSQSIPTSDTDNEQAEPITVGEKILRKRALAKQMAKTTPTSITAPATTVSSSTIINTKGQVGDKTCCKVINVDLSAPVSVVRELGERVGVVNKVGRLKKNPEVVVIIFQEASQATAFRRQFNHSELLNRRIKVEFIASKK